MEQQGGKEDGALLHRKVTLGDVLRLPVWEDYPAAESSARSAAGPPKAHRLVLRFGAPLVALCCVRVMGVVLRLRHEVGQRSVVLYIDDATGVVRVEYPAINLAYLAKQPEVGDLLDFLGEICSDVTTGERYINAYGMDHKKDGNWEALRYLEVVELYRHHYYREAFQDDEEADGDRNAEYAAMSASASAASSGGSKRGAPARHRRHEESSKAAPFTHAQDQRATYPSSPSQPQVVSAAPPVDGAAIEAMLRQQGSATLADIARRFPRCQNLVDVLENIQLTHAPRQMMFDGLLYEKEGRYHPL